MDDPPPRHDIDDAALAHLERLARLVIEPSEREALKHDLVELLGFVDSLLEVDVTGVDEYGRDPDGLDRGDMREPRSLHPTETLDPAGSSGPAGSVDPERSDTLTPSLPAAVALGLAPESSGGFIKVPRTVEEG